MGRCTDDPGETHPQQQPDTRHHWLRDTDVVFEVFGPLNERGTDSEPFEQSAIVAVPIHQTKQGNRGLTEVKFIKDLAKLKNLVEFDAEENLIEDLPEVVA